MENGKINVTVWNENWHEQVSEEVRKIYPEGIHGAIGEALLNDGSFNVNYATLDMPEHGLTDDVLNNTDVLFWWGHCKHGDVQDAIVDKIQKRVLEGMGLICLHSAHLSKIFRRMLGTSCTLCWREIGEKERVWNIEPSHPITQGIGKYFEIPHCEMYGERFDIPDPDKTIFISWYEGGEVFRSGVTFERGNGRIFYFASGHETFPIYYDENVRKVLCNAAKWAAPRIIREFGCPCVEPIENIKKK